MSAAPAGPAPADEPPRLVLYLVYALMVAALIAVLVIVGVYGT